MIFLVTLCVLVVFAFLPQTSFAAAKPAQVAGVRTESASASSIKVSWKKAKHAKSYKVYCKKATAKPYKAYKAGKKRSYTLKYLAPNTKYCIVVKAFNGKKSGKASKKYIAKTSSAITRQPSDVTVSNAGDIAAFDITAPTAISYQWYVDGTKIDDGTDSHYQDYSVDESLNGAKYYCIIKTKYGTEKSREAELNITSAPPSITKQPANVTTDVLKSFSFSVRARKAVSYRWYVKTPTDSDFAPLDNNTSLLPVVAAGLVSDTLVLDDTASTVIPDGTQFKCTIANSGREITSEAASVSYNLALSLESPRVDIKSPLLINCVISGGKGTVSEKWECKSISAPDTAFTECIPVSSTEKSHDASSVSYEVSFGSATESQVGLQYRLTVTDSNRTSVSKVVNTDINDSI